MYVRCEKNACKILDNITGRKRLLGRIRHRWKNITNMGSKK
jgi:hypothetical protein